jgi:hypothetical protein
MNASILRDVEAPQFVIHLGKILDFFLSTLKKALARAFSIEGISSFIT